MSLTAGRIQTALLALLILAAPLAFGGVAPWAQAGLTAGAFLCLALNPLAVRRLGDLKPALYLALPLAGLAFWGIVQSTPLPAGLVETVSPEHGRLYREAAGLLPEGTFPSSPRLSVAPEASRGAALAFAAAAALGVAAAAATASHREGRMRRRILAAAVLATALFEVLFGARGWFARSTEIWGVEVPSSPDRLRGTFVNSNHLSLYLEIGLPLAFAALWWGAHRARRQGSLDQRLLTVGPPALLWILLFLGIAFTGSRAGLVAAVAGVVVQGGAAALSSHATRSRRLLVLGLALAAALLGLATVFVVGRQQGLGRFTTLSPYEVSRVARLEAYAATVDLWRRFPLTGSGLGTFRDAFPLVQPVDLETLWSHAHNGPLEILATTGLPGTALLLTGTTLLLLRLGTLLARGRRSEDRAAALAGLGAVASISLHEALDFGLTLPGNHLTLAALLGAVLVARTREEEEEDVQASADELYRAREDATAQRRLDFEEVEAPGKRHRQLEDGSLIPFPTRRPRHREGAEDRPVEP